MELRYGREEVLDEALGVVKIGIKQGAECIPKGSKVWAFVEGHTEDGEVIQKEKKIVFENLSLYSASWQLAVPKMLKGEVSWVKSPPGSHIFTKFPNETLWFKITIEEYLQKRPKKASKDQSLQERLNQAELFLSDGNRLFRSCKYGEARTLYNTAKTFLEVKSELLRESGLKTKYTALKTKTLLNLAAVGLCISCDKKENLLKVVEFCNEVLKIKPCAKAYYRKAKALNFLGDYEEAQKVILLAFELEPFNKQIFQLKKQVSASLEPLRQVQKNLYKGIFNN